MLVARILCVDYLNLGPGGELAIYETGLGVQWDVNGALSMPMTQTIMNNKTGETYVNNYYDPSTWWITSFSPEHQGVGAADLTTTTTIDFSGQSELWAAFTGRYGNPLFRNGWTIDSSHMTATLRW